MKGERLPKMVYLDSPAALPRWIESVKKAAETLLYRTSVKVGGTLFKQMEKTDPNDPSIRKMVEDGVCDHNITIESKTVHDENPIEAGTPTTGFIVFIVIFVLILVVVFVVVSVVSVFSSSEFTLSRRREERGRREDRKRDRKEDEGEGERVRKNKFRSRGY